VFYLAVGAPLGTQEELEALDERQTFVKDNRRPNYFNSKKLRNQNRRKGRKGQVELETQLLVKRSENLEKRLDENLVEEESDVEKREQGWANKNSKLKRGEKKMVELEKRQMYKPRDDFFYYGGLAVRAREEE